MRLLRMRRLGALTNRVLATFLFAMVAVSAVPAMSAGAPVYILRGGLDVFSTGMNDLADKLNAQGVAAVSENFTRWRDSLADVTAAYKSRRYPIVIVGHSWAADTALLMAYELGKSNIPVALLVLYDATNTARVPANVKRVVNFRSTASIGRNVSITGTNRFAGKIDTIKVTDANHGQLDERDDLHEQTIAAIRRALGR